MPEVKWVWNYNVKDLGFYPGSEYQGHNKPVMVLTLDAIEAWLTAERKKALDMMAGLTIQRLITQVQAMKEGRT